MAKGLARRIILMGVIYGAVGVSGFAFGGVAVGQQQGLPYRNTSLPVAQRVDDLVGRMTLEEKAGQMMNGAAAIPRLGVPAYNYWSEGLHGIARSGYATLFPQAIGMAATWDAPLVGQIGTVASTEARAKYTDAVKHDNHAIYYGLTIWSPNINIFRDPRWGRGQETYGEDPYLTGRLGVAFVKGIQGDDPEFYRAIATPKHFAVHSGPESTRHKADVQPTPHDLEDTYLPAFRATITEARAASIMCAYNAVDGKPACASDLLLTTKLRDAWKFGGFVVSDCDAVADFVEHRYSADKVAASAAAVRAGTDLDCGRAYTGLVDAVKQGKLTESELDVSLKRVLTARMKLGLLGADETVPYARIPLSVVGDAEHRELALRAARESMVLLKNDGTLPLKKSVKTIAVIGPNAASLAVLEGNYNAIAKDPVMPVDAIVKEFAGQKVVYAPGAPWADGMRMVVPRTVLGSSAEAPEQGLTAEYFNGTEFAGKPAVTRVDRQIDFDWYSAAPVEGVSAKGYSVRWTGTFTAPVAGEYDLRLHVASSSPGGTVDSYKVWLDDTVVAERGVGPDGKAKETSKSAAVKDTKPHRLRVEYVHQAGLLEGGVKLEWKSPVEALQKQAVEAAQAADVVVAIVGLSPQLEGEEMNVHIDGFAGGDRTDLHLPAAQEEMLKAVAATGKPLVVVLMNGSALAVEWAKSHANAIVEAWYPGQAGGTAIAETLEGENNPAGRLPVTFYAKVTDLPAFEDYSMAGRTYRYFNGQPLFRFGDGLSYTRFAYSKLTLSAGRVDAGKSVSAEVDVTNAGGREGDEVAELYVTPPQGGVTPKLTLQGFQRVHLKAGETKHLRFDLGPRQLSVVDEKGVRAMAGGEYGVSVGGSQPGTGAEQQAKLTIVGREELPK